jgi:uncharacterized protein (UPF0210 family)
MTEQPKLPDPEKVKKTVAMLRDSNHQLEAVALEIEELIAMVEVEIRNSPINVYRREKAKRLAESINQVSES